MSELKLSDKDFTLPNKISDYFETIKNAKPELCPERAVLITESYSKTENDEPVIRRAKALKEILGGMSIYIPENERIAGNQAGKLKAAPVFPEYSISWLMDEIDSIPNRPSDSFIISEKTKKELSEVFNYWQPRTHYDRVYTALPEEVKKAEEIHAIWGENLLNNGDGHVIVDYAGVLNYGLKKILKEVKTARRSLDLTIYEDVKKVPFLDSLEIVYNAVKIFSDRYAGFAKSLAQKEKNSDRKTQLLLIESACRRVPMEPAETFFEALQSVWFIHLILQIESNGHSISLGRFDQYMYPFYSRDIETGRLTRDEAFELLLHFWLKLNTINKIRPWRDTQFITGYPMFQNLTVGGQDHHGKDAANELTFLCLKATNVLGVTQPSLSARFHFGSSEEYLTECSETIKSGFGMPAMFNDEVIIPSLLNRNIFQEDACDYAMVGCVEVAVPGKWGYRCNGMSYFNMMKVFELALNNGVDPKTGIYFKKGTGSLTDFKTYDDVINAWEEQIKIFTKLYIIHDTIADTYLEKYLPDPFCSMLVSDCVKRGKSLKEGGAKYDIVSAQSIGLANIANSLTVLKKLVFEEKLISLDQMTQAMESDYNGKNGNKIRNLIIKHAPKYGNDNDYVDTIASAILESYIYLLKKYKNTRYGRGPIGGNWQISTSTVSSNIPFGAFVGATPDGRRSGMPLADGCSPCQGTDVNGPTSTMNSVSKLPNILVSGGQLFNLKLNPLLVSGNHGSEVLVSLIKAFFEKKGWHVQFNVVDNSLLHEAKRNPGDYSDLIIRVAGYSAYFVELDPSLQDDIISRTEHNMNSRF